MAFTHPQITLIGLGLALLGLVTPLVALGLLAGQAGGGRRAVVLKSGALVIAGAANLASWLLPSALEESRLQRWADAKARAIAAGQASRFDEMRQVIDAADPVKGRLDFINELMAVPGPSALPPPALQQMVADCHRDAQAEGAAPWLELLRDALNYGRVELVDALARGHAACAPAEAAAWRDAVRQDLRSFVPVGQVYGRSPQRLSRQWQAEALAALVGHDPQLLDQNSEAFGCGGYLTGPTLPLGTFRRCTLFTRLFVDGHREAVLRLLPMVEDPSAHLGPLAAALLKGDVRGATAAADQSPDAVAPLMPRLFAVVEPQPLAAWVAAREISLPWKPGKGTTHDEIESRSALEALFQAAYERDADQPQWPFIEIALRLLPGRADALDPWLYHAYFEQRPATDTRVIALVRQLQQAGVSCAPLAAAIGAELREGGDLALYQGLTGCPLTSAARRSRSP